MLSYPAASPRSPAAHLRGGHPRTCSGHDLALTHVPAPSPQARVTAWVSQVCAGAGVQGINAGLTQVPAAWELPATPKCMPCALWAGVGVYLGAVPLWSACLSICLSVFVSSGGGGAGPGVSSWVSGIRDPSSFTSLLQQQAQGPAPAVLGSSGPAAADGHPWAACACSPPSPPPPGPTPNTTDLHAGPWDPQHCS